MSPLIRYKNVKLIFNGGILMGRFSKANILFFSFISLFSFSTVWAQEAIGVINELVGNVVLRPVHSQDSGRSVVDVTSGMKLNVGDEIETKAGGMARLMMADKNVFILQENTVFTIRDYSVEESAGRTHLRVKGGVHSEIHKKYDNENSTIRLETPSAVVGVRGTEFYLEHKDNTTVTTFDGVVEMANKMDVYKLVNPTSIKKGYQFGSDMETPKEIPAKELRLMKYKTRVLRKPKT